MESEVHIYTGKPKVPMCLAETHDLLQCPLWFAPKSCTINHVYVSFPNQFAQKQKLNL